MTNMVKQKCVEWGAAEWVTDVLARFDVFCDVTEQTNGSSKDGISLFYIIKKQIKYVDCDVIYASVLQ